MQSATSFIAVMQHGGSVTQAAKQVTKTWKFWHKVDWSHFSLTEGRVGRGECVGRVQVDFMFDMKSRQGEIYHDNNNNDNLELSQRFGNICHMTVATISHTSCPQIAMQCCVCGLLMDNMLHIYCTPDDILLLLWVSRSRENPSAAASQTLKIKL